ncbi:RNase A-like domain-containing protein [Parageobacillus toebii]|uniref:RNase A-like domain-containing protein n=1 Tax=Parageobacillus toebii TaxID=153151 RepID=UPI002E1B9BA1|nr:pre-toxin TG domain-containing protein [Parageobacillus toebii]
MTTIRVNPEELEAVAEHVPDAEDGCSRARTSLSWEFPSLVMKIPGIGTDAIDHLRDELIHWLDRYEEKLNEAEELLYRTAAAIRQADQTLADNMKEFGLELLGWYDLQRLFGEYDPVTGERISGWDRLFAGGMLLLSVIPPAKGAGVAGKAAIKGAKAAETAVDVSKWISKTRNVLNVNKIKGALQTIYHQVIKGPITETIRSFKKQWENFLENVGSVLQGSQLAIEGVGVVPSGRMIGIAEESASSVRISMSQAEDEVVGKGTGNVKHNDFSPLAPGGGLAAHEARGGHLIARHVGKTDAELLQRLKDNPKITGASTFTDRATAEKVASEVLNDPNNKKIIQAWLSNPKIKSTLVLPYQGTEIIGRGVQRGSTTVEHMTNAKIVLKKDGAGGFILTGYPTK